LAYVSAWLKYHYPAAFCVALLNSQPMGFYAPAQLVRNAQEHGVEIRPVDVNHSRWDCTLEDGAVRLGLRMIVGLPSAQAMRVEQTQPFQSMDDFTRRSGVPSNVSARLAKADAFGSLKMNRRASLWQALVPTDAKGARPLFDDIQEDTELPIDLPAMDDRQEVFADYRTVGLSLKAHPISFFRSELDQLDIAPAARLANLKDGRFVRVAGLVLVRQRPGTAKGITFVTLEDETGVANLIIKMDVWERFYTVARTASAYIASGRLQNQQGVIHVLVSRIENLNDKVGELRSRSRDFQ
jgi:error-prone DNA polymerase